MADKEIKVKVNVDANVEPSIAQLKALKRQLKDTAAGSKEFKELANQIDDLEDKLKGAKQGAADWIDTLESAPGPLGALGGALNKAKVATVSFGTALKAIGIGLIVSAIAGLVAAFNESEKASKKLQPILIGFQRIFNGIFAALEPVIDAVLELATKAMPYVTQAFGVAYSAISSFLQGIGKLGSALYKLFKGDFAGAWEDAKASVTEFGKRYDEANQNFIAGTKELTSTEKEELEKRQKQNEEAARKRQEAAEKEKERLRKEAEEKKKILDEANKAELDAYKETLSSRDKELYEAGLTLNERLAAVTKAGVGDRTLIQEAYRLKVKEINDKYDKEEKDKADKKAEEDKKRIDDYNKWVSEQYEKIKEFNDKRAESEFNTNQLVAQSWVDLGQNIANTIGSLINVFDEGSDLAKAFGIAQVAINAASSIGQILVNSKAAGFEYDKTIATGNAAILSSIPKLVNPITAPIGIAEAAAGKAAIAGAVAGKAALKVKTGLQIGAVAVSSAAQIAGILSAKKSGSGGAKGGGGAEAGGAAIPSPQVASIAAPQINLGQGQNAASQIGETIATAQKPIRAYVVSGDVSSQQALDRRTSRAATFAGG